MPEKPPLSSAVRAEVRRLIDRAAGFRTLSPDEQERLADDMTTIGVALVTVAAAHQREAPGFVRDLVEGTFEAVVDGSIEQARAYVELVASVAAEDDPRGVRERLIKARPGIVAKEVGVSRVGHKIKWPP